MRHPARLNSPLPPLLTLLLIAAAWAMPVGAQSSAPDPQSLVGEWTGSWKPVGPGGHEASGGRYYLAVTKVEGGRVFGRVESTGAAAGASDFRGTLEGNRLTFGRGSVQTELTIQGTRCAACAAGPDEATSS